MFTVPGKEINAYKQWNRIADKNSRTPYYIRIRQDITLCLWCYDKMITTIPKGDINTIWGTFPKVSVGHIQHVDYNNRTFPIHVGLTAYIPIHWQVPPNTPMVTSQYTDGNILIHRREHLDTLFPDDMIPPKRKVVSRRLGNKKPTTNYIIHKVKEHGLIHHEPEGCVSDCEDRLRRS